MNELALFAGAGGGLLGSRLLGWRTVCAVEVEPYCIEVLMRRQEEGHMEPFPIWDDVRTFDGRPWRGKVDVISAGFPCQPFSVAGQRKAEDDNRNLWPETIRTIREVGPRFALLENVPGLLAHQYFGTILGDLAESGYGVRWRCLSASEVGAPHRRDRLWIVADAATLGRERREDNQGQRQAGGDGAPLRCSWWDTDPADLPDAEIRGCGMCGGPSWEAGHSTRIVEAMGDAEGRTERAGLCESEKAEKRCGRLGDTSTRPTQPFVGRVAHGVAHRVDRLRAIGNGQVPAVVRAAWMLLSE